ncbi:hypothetical protein PR048_012698 [Dryococelus australis]|uniref:Uncharacterized protein n=1 Tax=Dryococelus australis TaxID=614101 RepID=A0ABQ9HQ26_9NEOP|nr:hypothetical protein PR048_012698 [Dryococelus australis]
MKESYSNMKLILRVIKYHEFQWQICRDLKVVALLLGMQLGYTKFCCFIFEWDSRACALHYTKSLLETGKKKESRMNPLLIHKKILLPPLYFVKAISKDGEACKYLRAKFSRLSEAKVKKGVFVGPQISEIFCDTQFNKVLQGDEKTAWESFAGNKRADNYIELVEDLLSSYEMLGCTLFWILFFHIIIWTSF